MRNMERRPSCSERTNYCLSGEIYRIFKTAKYKRKHRKLNEQRNSRNFHNRSKNRRKPCIF